jgi:1-acyl-sn-glycerol-3-phosphate acyltransferase
VRGSIRFIAAVTGTRVHVHGLDRLPPPGQPCILVANHSSYLDNPLLVLALPRRFSFVAKAELRSNPAIHLFLRRIETEFVERSRARRSARDLQTLSARVRQGRTLLFFPEGTLRREPGLLPFRIGAFITAAAQDVPVVPVTIDGSRALLTDRDWRPRRGEVTVTVGQPLHPRDYNGGGALDRRQTAQALREAARHEILQYCGESEARSGTAGPDGPGA